MPNATAMMANSIKTIEAQTAKAISDESGRPCIAMGGYETVGENRVMLSLNRFFERDCVDRQGRVVKASIFHVVHYPNSSVVNFLPEDCRARLAPDKQPRPPPARWGVSGFGVVRFSEGR
jgi:hypothetical protein